MLSRINSWVLLGYCVPFVAFQVPVILLSFSCLLLLQLLSPCPLQVFFNEEGQDKCYPARTNEYYLAYHTAFCIRVPVVLVQ